MVVKSGLLVATAAMAALVLPSPSLAATDPTAEASAKPRLIVITDIGAEPDDLESMVRLLTYANELDIEGLIASTSTHLRDRVYPELIEERVKAYGAVLPNLRVHAKGYPDARVLLSRIRSTPAIYGMAGVGSGKDNYASRLIIETVDKADSRPVWISIWGGAAPLAQALWTVRATRSPAEVDRFIAKLRVYSISDQDDAGPWARANFPQLFWIASIHGFTHYELSTWTGISANAQGADPMPVSRQWLNENVRSHGALGAVYPSPMFIMEGDTPSFLYLVPNGLGSPEHPNWGSWGGRYDQPSREWGLWADTQDSVKGVDGKAIKNNKATVWRWRSAFQNDFATRMDWSISPRFRDANHPPAVMLNGQGGQLPVELRACPGQSLKLSAAGSKDPDGQALTYRWWRYSEPSGLWSPNATVAQESGPDTTVTVPLWTQPFDLTLPESYRFHVMLEVTDKGTPALTRYRRAVITVPTKGGTSDTDGCDPVEIGPRPPEPKVGGVSPIHAIASGRYSTADTPIGVLLDDPAAREIIDRNIPGLSSQAGESPQAREMTLRAVQHFDPRLTDQLIDQIDAEFARLPAN